MSDSRALPYYRWYVVDFRASRPVNRLNYIEKGLYRTLLDECWLEGHIPDDIVKLADICDCPVGVMAEAWPNIRLRFRPIEGLDGMYLQNRRLEVERTELDGFRVRQSLAGKASAMKRKQATTVEPRLTTVNQLQPAVAVAVAEQSIAVDGGSVPPVVAPPSPHGEARLADGLDVLIAKAKRGEITRGTVS